MLLGVCSSWLNAHLTCNFCQVTSFSFLPKEPIASIVTFWRYQFEQIHFNIIKIYTHTNQRDLQQWVGRPHTSVPSCSICSLPELCQALLSQTKTQDMALEHWGGWEPHWNSSPVIFLLIQWANLGRKQGIEICSYKRSL